MSNEDERHGASLREAFAKDVVDSLQQLIETKHLYQSVVIEFPNANRVADATPPLKSNIISEGSIFGMSTGRVLTPKEQKVYAVAGSRKLIKMVADQPWFFQIEGVNPRTVSQTHFTLPTVRISCAFCDGVLPPHNPGYRNYSEHPHTLKVSGEAHPITQLFSIPFQCQNCKGEPVVFYIRREGAKLQIVGRSQFELVDVPKVIPKQEREHYRDAIISFNSGRGLAALFFLRTLVEQYMRRVTGITDPLTRGDELAEQYHKLLKTSFPAEFRTFRTLYGELSDRLHRAAEDEDLFRDAQKKIDAHFDMLRMIPIQPPTKANSPAARVGA